jgi:hypothetical protein
MVSAYEAHLVNVTATVENALYVTREAIDFGTVFPEMWLTEEFRVKHSDSFCYTEQDRVDGITYGIYVVRKPVPPDADPYPDPVDNYSGEIYYHWLGDALWIGVWDLSPTQPIPPESERYPFSSVHPEGKMVRVTTDPDPDPATKILVLTSNISKETPWGKAPNQWIDYVVVGLDVPVFLDQYNPLTDPEPKPSGLDDPSANLSGERNVQGIELGAEIKIQVLDVFTWP